MICRVVAAALAVSATLAVAQAPVPLTYTANVTTSALSVVNGTATNDTQGVENIGNAIDATGATAFLALRTNGNNFWFRCPPADQANC